MAVNSLKVMKRIFLIAFILWLPLLASAQDTINPYNTQQAATIELHGKLNVYYKPYYPPAPDEASDSLCSVAPIIYDSDGVSNPWPWYQPWVRGEGEADDTPLYKWKPYGTPMGMAMPWQRFFTAKRDATGNPHDIIAGGNPGDSIVISKGEDVDFRASGTIKLKSGFHALPGCRFHAYTEPKYDSVIFSDNFDSINHAKWYIANGNGDGYGVQSHCSTDTDVAITLDSEATDGYALDIFLRENRTVGGTLDTCHYLPLGYSDFDSCDGKVLTPPSTDTNRIFYSSDVRACPFPYLRRDTLPLVPANEQLPYGKYEIRKKIPHFPHHINDWPVGSWEIDMNETAGDTGDMHYLFPNFHQSRRYGPFKGMFHRMGTYLHTGDPLIDSVIFVSHDADWSLVNSPHYVIINNFCYEVWPMAGNKDSIALAPRTFGFMGWPASLANDTTDSVTFYYERNGGNTADLTTWTVDSTGRKFSAPYHDSSGTLLRFSKEYQPTSVTLTISGPPQSTKKSFNCHWEYNLNPPHGTGDSGFLYLDNPLDSTDLHSYSEAYGYSVEEDIMANIYPAAPFDMYDTVGDYKYHTFAVEILPHELRYLIDSNVVLRLPDRLIPPGDPHYGLNLDREPLDFYLGELDLGASDPLGADSTSLLYQEKTYFEAHPYNPGFRDVTIDGKTYHAAHELIDYVRVWGTPKDVTVPNFPK
jgi:hypothetical protein